MYSLYCSCCQEPEQIDMDNENPSMLLCKVLVGTSIAVDTNEREKGLRCGYDSHVAGNFNHVSLTRLKES